MLYLSNCVSCQLESAVFDLHEMLFDLPVKEQMHIIALDRGAKRERSQRQKLKVSLSFAAYDVLLMNILQFKASQKEESTKYSVDYCIILPQQFSC
jgi:hypothetical protein